MGGPSSLLPSPPLSFELIPRGTFLHNWAMGGGFLSWATLFCFIMWGVSSVASLWGAALLAGLRV